MNQVRGMLVGHSGKYIGLRSFMGLAQDYMDKPKWDTGYTTSLCPGFPTWKVMLVVCSWQLGMRVLVVHIR